MSLPGEHEEIEAVWERNDDEQYRRDQSHWRQHGRWDDEQWRNIGRRTQVRVADLYRTAGRDPWRAGAPVLLEWGPGGGSNLCALAHHCSALVGVDISRKNLDESARVLAEEAPGTTFVPIHLAGEPDSIIPLVTSPIDLVVSTAVFQHFPSREYGGRVLQTMQQVMSPGALGLIQIRFDNGNPKYQPKPLAAYREQHITATSYDLSAFWDLLITSGFRPLKISDVATTNNYACFYFLRR